MGGPELHLPKINLIVAPKMDEVRVREAVGAPSGDSTR